VATGTAAEAVRDLSAFKADCPCPKRKCGRHGWCEECAAYHGRKGRLPHCKR